MQKTISIASQAQILDFFKKCYGVKTKKIYAFYNNIFNKIITDQHLMLIPIDQRMATRAHGVFDVIYVKKLSFINLNSHLSRLVKSCESVQIVPPLNQNQMHGVIHKVMAQLIKQMIRGGSSKQNLMNQVFGIRLSISSGFGDFGIASIDKKPPYISYGQQKQGVNQFVVKIEKQPKELVHAKTVNYVDNALMANLSKQKGGYQGIKATQQGVLLQAAVANIAFIFGTQFATPRFETVIQGTTIKKLLKFVGQLKQQGKITKISFRDITIEQAEQNATQMIVIGGDKIVPVLKFNGKQISEKKGKFTELFQQWYEKQNQKCEPIVLQ